MREGPESRQLGEPSHEVEVTRRAVGPAGAPAVFESRKALRVPPRAAAASNKPAWVEACGTRV